MPGKPRRPIVFTILLLLALLGVGKPVVAQQYNFNYDSLGRAIRRQAEDTAKVQAYLDYATQFYYSGSDSAFYYLLRAKSLGARFPKSYSYASCLKQEGDLNAIRGTFVKAVTPYREGIGIATERNYHLLLIKLLGNLANTYKNLGRLDSAMRLTEQLTTAFAGHVHTHQDSIAFAFHHFQLFDIYRVQGFEKEAILYGEKGYHLSLPLKFFRGIGYGLYVLGLKNYQENPVLGLEYCRQAMEIAVANNIPELQIFVRSLRADIYIQTGMYQLAEKELLKNRPYQANSIRLVTASRLSKVYYHQRRLVEALREHQQAIQLADTLDYRAELIEVLKNGITIYQGKGDYQAAFRLLERLGRVKEEIASELLKRDYQRWSLQYKVSEKDRELAENKLIITQKDNHLHQQSLLTILGGLVFALVAIFVWYSYRQQQRLQQQRVTALEASREVQTLEAMIQGEERERSRIAKDLHDGIGGLLSAVKMHFSTVQNDYPALKNSPSYAGGLTLLDEASGEVRKTAHNLMPDMLRRFGLDEALHLFCQKVSTSPQLRVDYQSVGEIGRYQDSFELAVYRIVQELVNNLLKHANASQALVQISRHGEVLTISVEDNGQGFQPEAVEKGSGLGLSSLAARVASLGGAMDINTDIGEGTAIYIELNTCSVAKSLIKEEWNPSK